MQISGHSTWRIDLVNSRNLPIIQKKTAAIKCCCNVKTVKSYAAVCGTVLLMVVVEQGYDSGNVLVA